MIVVRVKKSHRGELVLPTVGYAVKANTKLTLNREQFYANDIQAALRNGIIELEDDSGRDQWSPIKHYKVKNVSGKVLTVAENLAFLVGEAKFLSETSYLDIGVQSAIESGWLESEELADVEVRRDTYRAREKRRKNREQYEEEQTAATESPPSPSPKRRPKREKSKPQKAAKKNQSKNVKTAAEEVVKLDGPQTNMQSWDAVDQRAVSREDSNQMVAPRIQGHEPEERQEDVQVGDIDFSDIKIKTKAKSKRSSKGAKGKKGKKGLRQLRPVGHRRPEPGDVSSANAQLPNESSLVDGFVDTEQLSAKMSRHPDERIAGNNSEVE